MIEVIGPCLLAAVIACFAVMLGVFGLEVRDIWRYWRRRG